MAQHFHQVIQKTPQFWNILSPKETLSIPIFSSSSGCWQPPIYFLLCGFAYSGHFTYMYPQSTVAFVTGFFHLACSTALYPWG